MGAVHGRLLARGRSAGFAVEGLAVSPDVLAVCRRHWRNRGLVATELQRFRLQYWSLAEFGHLLADAGFADISVTADHREDHRPGPDSNVWTSHAVRPR